MAYYVNPGHENGAPAYLVIMNAGDRIETIRTRLPQGSWNTIAVNEEISHRGLKKRPPISGGRNVSFSCKPGNLLLLQNHGVTR